MPDIQDATIARKLARRFGLKGSSLAPTISPEVVPVALVSDLSLPTEEDTGFSRTCIGSVALSASAGNRSEAQLHNPAGSGSIVTLEAVIVAAANAVQIQHGRGDNALTDNNATLDFRDGRLGGNPGADVRSVQQVATSIAVVSITTRIPANDAALFPLGVILRPGQGWVVEVNGLNEALDTTFYWLERALLQGE